MDDKRMAFLVYGLIITNIVLILAIVFGGVDFRSSGARASEMHFPKDTASLCERNMEDYFAQDEWSATFSRDTGNVGCPWTPMEESAF